MQLKVINVIDNKAGISKLLIRSIRVNSKARVVNVLTDSAAN